VAGVSVVDLAVGGVVLVSALLAFARGFTREVLAVVAWVAAIFATIFGFQHVQPIAEGFVQPPWLADGAAATVLFLVTLVAVTLVSRFIAHRVQGSGLGTLDRSLGFLFGLARGAVIVCLAYLLFIQAVPPEEQPVWASEARSRPLVEAGAGVLLKLAPEDIRERAEKAIEEASEQAELARPGVEMLLQPPAGSPDDAAEGDVGYNDDERNQIGTILKSTEGEGQ
jgi:membrane protein required for colicin V production